MSPRPSRLFDVVGIEVDHELVDDRLRPVPRAGDAFGPAALRARRLARGGAVFEPSGDGHSITTGIERPARSLARADRDLHVALEWLAGETSRRAGAALLPAGLNPAARSAGDAARGRATGPGDRPGPACRVSLPLGQGDRDFALLHDAVACLVPYLPALAASSPAWGGRLRRELDGRLSRGRRRWALLPGAPGDGVPERVASRAQWRTRILRPQRAALRGLAESARLEREWLDSQGAAPRWPRPVLEIRVLDVQECPRMDVALAAFVRRATQAVAHDLASGAMTRPPQAVLARDFRRVIRDGRFARVDARHLRPGPTREDVPARPVLERWLARAASFAPAEELPYLTLVQWILDTGSLAERLRAGVSRRTPDGRRTAEAIRDTYLELPACLVANRPFGDER